MADGWLAAVIPLAGLVGLALLLTPALPRAEPMAEQHPNARHPAS